MKLLKILGHSLKMTKTTQPVVIFDIGSASIGGAVVFFDKKIPNITYCTRTQLPFQEVADKRRLLPLIEETLAQVANNVQRDGLRPTEGRSVVPLEIVCVLSSLWSNTQTTSASFKHREKFRVTDRVMDNLLAQIHKSNKREEKEVEITIEEIVINSLLNGYPTQSPLGKEAQHIDVTFLESTVAEELHTKISNVIYGVFSPDISLLFRSFALVSFSVARDMFESVKDFLLIDVTGEITELAVVRDSILEDTLSFPYGRNTLIRDITRKTGSVPEDILARVKISFSNNEPEKKAVIFEEEKQWTKMFERACGELSSEISPLPRDVFLIADTNYEEWFRGMIKQANLNGLIATQEIFRINLLIGKQIKEVCTLHSGVVQDSFLIMDSLLYNREYLSRRS